MCNVFMSTAHPHISRVSPKANLCCFFCVNPQFPCCWWPLSTCLVTCQLSLHRETTTARTSHDEALEPWNVVLWLYPADEEEGPPHCCLDLLKPPGTFARLVMSYSFHKAKTSSVRLREAATSSFFRHLYVSKCPLWQIAIPHHIRSNLELPHCFTFFWAEVMLNKGRHAERGRGSVSPARSAEHNPTKK